MVLIAAFLGWLFDGFEIGLFPVVARPALLSLLPGGSDVEVGPWMARITACFLVGAAFGGLAFGYLGDRIGRVRALAASILTYSLFTGLSYFAQTPSQLGALRFLGALGMGGEWSLGVALVMECWPEKWRPTLAGAIGAAANVGFLLTGVVAKAREVTPDSWRWMFLVGATPALLVFFILFLVPESERWKQSVRVEASKPVREVFAPVLRRRTILAIVFAAVALIGTWGSVQWLPLWADQLAQAQYSKQVLDSVAAKESGQENATQMQGDVSLKEARKKASAAKAETQMVQGIGAILGCLLAPLLGARFGRRPAYCLLCLCSLVLCGWMFRTIHSYGAGFLFMSFLVSAFTASFYGWFPLYLPELFPTRVRATGQGLSYNFGRILAAGGALVQGQLVAALGGSYPQAGAVVTLIYLAGMALIWLAPETKGHPLPE
jgi:MFS family permease